MLCQWHSHKARKLTPWFRIMALDQLYLGVQCCVLSSLLPPSWRPIPESSWGETVNTSKGEERRRRMPQRQGRSLREHFFLGNNDGKYINLWYYDDFCDGKWRFLFYALWNVKSGQFLLGKANDVCTNILGGRRGAHLTWYRGWAPEWRIRPQNSWIVL